MGANWNKKRSVEESNPQWRVIAVILLLILLPLVGGLALAYFAVNGASTLLLVTLGGLCLASWALPLGALFVLTRRSKKDMAARDQEAQL